MGRNGIHIEEMGEGLGGKDRKININREEEIN